MIIEITNKYIQLIIFIHSKIFKRFGFNIYQKTHVAGGLPLPIKNGTRIRVHFFENLYPYENIMSIKKKFHQWTKKLPAKQQSQISPDSDHLGRFGCAA